MTDELQFSEFDLDAVACGREPSDELRAALERSPELRAELERRKLGFGGWSDFDERPMLAAIRARMHDEPTQAARGSLSALGLLIGAVLGAAAVIVSFVAQPVPPPPPEPIAKVPPAPEPMRLADGSFIRPDPSSNVVIESVSSREVQVRLDTGRARFEVSERPERVFQVSVGDLSVQVLGTEFSVERSDAEAYVVVTEGRVRVRFSGGERELAANERASFPYSAAVTPPVEPTPDDTVKPSPRKPRRPLDKPAPETWQKLVETGQHDAAFEALQESGGTVRNEVAQLMLAADAARYSGHPQDAVIYFERVVREHSDDARAPVAAFTLGGMYMRALRDSRKAAEMFQAARRLAPQGPLAGDALAREVEAWARLGNTDKARAAAEEYLRVYPDGDQVSKVKRYGKLK
ncbi:MAG: FecR domain-containing protein [Myxococcota bacterium]